MGFNSGFKALSTSIILLRFFAGFTLGQLSISSLEFQEMSLKPCSLQLQKTLHRENIRLYLYEVLFLYCVFNCQRMAFDRLQTTREGHKSFVLRHSPDFSSCWG